MSQWSVDYYESTAVRGDAYGGGLSEYYSERDTRAPVVMVAGDNDFARESMGVEHGGSISAAEVKTWFGEGIPPAGPGVGKPRAGTPGWDVLVTVPKSVSLLAALTPDKQVGTFIMNALAAATEDAMTYLHRHAGYTRVTNPLDSSKKDLQRLPSLPFVSYFHHTARPTEDGTCDPHMHIHCLMPGKVARADGRMVSVDSQSVYHESKAAGMILQKSLRDRMSAGLGAVWGEVDPRTGIAELKGFDRDMITAFSRRRSALMEWAERNPSDHVRDLADIERDDEDKSGADSVADIKWRDAAQKATRNKKLETLHYDELTAQWRADPRAAAFDASQFLGQLEGVTERDGPGRRPEAAAVYELLAAKKNSWTRADMVEAVVGLWGPGLGLSIDSVEDIEAAVDAVIDAGCYQIVEDARSWHREGHLRFTDAATLTREAEVLELCSVKAAHLEVTTPSWWFAAQGLDATAAHAMTEIAVSRRLVNILEAPAGSGKTTALKAFRERAEAQGRHVVLLSSQRKAINAAREKDAASEYLTLAQFELRRENNTLGWDRNTIVVMDEAGMTGDRQMHAVITEAAATRAKFVGVGDSHQLQPVDAGGGMFRDLSEQLPWTQTFGHVWRQRDVEEKAMTLLMRESQTESEIRTVGHWYATHGRLAAGDETSMADKLVVDYFNHVVDGRDVLVMADQWKRAIPLNMRIQNLYRIAMENELGASLSYVPIARDMYAYTGDIVMTKDNTWDYELTPDPATGELTGGDVVTNADRWRVLAADPTDGSLHVRRLGDNAETVLTADYVREHVVLGYVGTMHAAQGSTAEVGLAIGDAATMTKNMLYPGMTRGELDNKLYLTVAAAGENEHHHEHSDTDPQPRVYSDIEAQAMFMSVLRRDDRQQTALAVAEEALTALAAGDAHTDHSDAFGGVHPYAAQLVHSRAGRRTQWAQEYSVELAERSAHQDVIDRVQERARDRGRDIGRERGEDTEISIE